jgi:hypothetical protein
MGSGTWRKAYGALKDSTRVGLANFNSEYKVTTTMPMPMPRLRLRSILPAAPPYPVAWRSIRLSSIFPPGRLALRHITMAIVKAF